MLVHLQVSVCNPVGFHLALLFCALMSGTLFCTAEFCAVPGVISQSGSRSSSLHSDPLCRSQPPTPKIFFFPKLLVNTLILIDSLYKVSHVPFKLYLHNVHLRATRFCYNRESHNKPIVLILMFYLFSKCHYNALFAPPPPSKKKSFL